MGSEALTYHERKGLGWGTVKERLGKDSQSQYYECCLTLQPAAVRPGAPAQRSWGPQRATAGAAGRYAPSAAAHAARAQRPVATEHGHIFDKEALLSYYVGQRKEKERQLEAWEAEQARLAREARRRAR